MYRDPARRLAKKVMCIIPFYCGILNAPYCLPNNFKVCSLLPCARPMLHMS